MAAAFSSRALLLRALDALNSDRLAEAETACRHALRDLSAGDEACDLLAAVAQRRGDLSTAIGWMRCAIVADETVAQYSLNLGRLLRQAGRLGEADGAVRHALALQPGHLEALRCLAEIAVERGRTDDALALYRRAVAHYPGDGALRAALGQLLLGRGDFVAGWQEYRHRPRTIRAPGTPALGAPWQGEAPAGERLLIYAEQGYGDTIQFCRWLRFFEDAQPPVILRIPAALRRLLAESMPWLIVEEDIAPVGPHDRHCSVMDLPALLAAGPAAPPVRPPYLAPRPAAVAAWRSRLGGGPRIGLAWAGDPRHVNDAARSLPADLLAGFLGRAGVGFVSLQVGGRAAEAARLDPAIRDLSPLLTDFAETAAAIAALDLVVTVDTAVAHLVGALARPGFVLLPCPADWRWLEEGADTPWYPTLRLFRQAAPGDWRAPIDELVAALPRP